MSEQVAALLKDFRACGWRIATAESCTGGLVAAAITDIAGSSDVFERGVVTYSNEAKCDLLGVNPGTLAAYGAVSEPVALEMAEGLLASSPADVAISVTGIAGPGGSENKPEGRVCFGLGVRNRNTHTETVEFGSLGRAAVRKAAVERALALLHSAVRLR